MNDVGIDTEKREGEFYFRHGILFLFYYRKQQAGRSTFLMINLDVLFHLEIFHCTMVGIDELLWVTVDDGEP